MPKRADPRGLPEVGWFLIILLPAMTEPPDEMNERRFDRGQLSAVGS